MRSISSLSFRGIARVAILACVALWGTLEPPASQPDKSFVPLFNGETLDGWTKVGGDATFAVEDGAIIGRVGPGSNTFLRTKRSFDDFELTLEFKWEEHGNSGIQFRSHQRDGTGRVYGYQCELDPSERAWTGGLYDEGRRGWLYPLKGMEAKQAAVKLDDWNTVRIRAVGDHLQTWVNDVPIADLRDDADASGFIALQVHSGDQGVILWRKIRIRELK